MNPTYVRLDNALLSWFEAPGADDKVVLCFNHKQTYFFPPVTDRALSEEPLSVSIHSDGTWGAFDYSIHPQYYDARSPWLGWICLLSDNSHQRRYDLLLLCPNRDMWEVREHARHGLKHNKWCSRFFDVIYLVKNQMLLFLKQLQDNDSSLSYPVPAAEWAVQALYQLCCGVLSWMTFSLAYAWLTQCLKELDAFFC